jgi:DNA-binding CsgD family transcriptional regulator
MNLTGQETKLVFSIMRDLSGDFDHVEIRQRVGRKLLELLRADYFASYVWDENTNKFVSGIQINMSWDNLERYDNYYQFRDPITPTLQRRRKATTVSEIMRHDKLVRTEFFNDFLKRDGLCFGLNYFAYDRGINIGDIRIWRGEKQVDFSKRDALIIDAIGPSFVNALIRARKVDTHSQALRFSEIREQLGFTTREAEVSDLLAIGSTDEEICENLVISKPTLRTHISAIFRKSGLNRRTQLARYLTEKIIISDDSPKIGH